MAQGAVSILVFGAAAPVRTALAAAALRRVLGDQARVLALTGAAPAALVRTVRVVEAWLGESLELAGCAPGQLLPPCDLTIAVDPDALTMETTPKLAPAGGYLVVWPGEEPAADDLAATYQELLERVQQLPLGPLWELAQVRAARRQGRVTSELTPGGELDKPTAGTLTEARPPLPRVHGLVGQAPSMQVMYRKIRKFGDSHASVLVLGETGTGKDLIARALHAESPRRNKPFVAINCATVSGDVVESELFGHVRGAFTGAVSSRAGLFAAAEGGTLFLDEVGDLPLPAQAKLLRALESREVRPVGSERAVKVDVRIVAATHRDLARGVAEGWFREDLYHRLAVAVLRSPALRERLDDLPLLTEHFLEDIRRETGRNFAPVPSTVLHLWMAYHWPGNLRELRNLLVRAVLDASGLELPSNALEPGDPQASAWLTRSPSPATSEVQRTVRRVVTKDEVAEALARTRGERKRAAQLLGISRATLYRVLNDLR
jgi:DNA-binding NtrC family response regulator